MTISAVLWSLTLSGLSLHLQLHLAAAGGSYAPTTDAPCPDSSSLVRAFSGEQSTNSQERAYINALEEHTLPNAWSDWLSDASDIHYNFSAFPAGTFPRIGIGVGGNGYRGALYGAAVLSALDGRVSDARKRGTGGLLQVASYIAGSSGGSWLTVSMLLNNWPTTPDLVNGDGSKLQGWMLDQDLCNPSDDDSQNQELYQAVRNGVKSKADSGASTSIVDSWGRLLAYHFLNGTDEDNMYDDSVHGAGQLWSSVPQTAAFLQHAVPFPLLVSDSLHEKQNVSGVLPLNNVVYEFSPYEFGSWDPNLAAMVDVAYTGTHLSNGSSANGKCTTGFDQASFVMGTSANIFSGILSDGSVDGFSNSDQEVLLNELNLPSNSPNNAAANWPNPFQGMSSSTFSESNSSWLELVDGAANGETVPLGSLFVNSRSVDVVVALDAGADTADAWPNGTSLLQSSNRIQNILSSSHQRLPPIPSSATDFINYGTNMRPTFFGCDPEQNPPEWPLVIYLPNSPPLDGSHPHTNPSSDTFYYSDDLISEFMKQAYTNVVGGFVPNKTGADPEWDLCLKCAAIDRARYKATSNGTSSSTATLPTQGILYPPSSYATIPQATYPIPTTSVASSLLPSSFTQSLPYSISQATYATSVVSVAPTTELFSQAAEPTSPAVPSAAPVSFAGSRRVQTSSVIQRSDVCEQCFRRYCYNPSSPPAPGSVTGRQETFQQPLGGLSQVEWWVKNHKTELAGLVLSVVAVIAGSIGGIVLWRKRREKKRRYYRVEEFDEERDQPWKHYERNGEQYELIIQ